MGRGAVWLTWTSNECITLATSNAQAFAHTDTPNVRMTLIDFPCLPVVYARHVRVSVHVVWVPVHVCLCVCMCIRAHLCACIRACMHACVRAPACVFVLLSPGQPHGGGGRSLPCLAHLYSEVTQFRIKLVRPCLPFMVRSEDVWHWVTRELVVCGGWDLAFCGCLLVISKH